MTATLADKVADQQSMLPTGGICCDIHPGVPGNAALLPYLEPQ